MNAPVGCILRLLGGSHSFELVLKWELDLVSIPELQAVVHEQTIVVREEESPAAVAPTGEETTGGVQVDEPVPDVGDQVFKQSHNYKQ